MLDSIQIFLIRINHSLCPCFFCVMHFDSIHDFLNRIMGESNQNTLTRIIVFFWCCFLVCWFESQSIESYPPSSRLLWFDSSFVWFVSIFISPDCLFVHIWIESDFWWFKSLRCFWLTFCTCHSFLYIDISLQLPNHSINCNYLSWVSKPLFPLILQIKHFFLRIFVVFES